MADVASLFGVKTKEQTEKTLRVSLWIFFGKAILSLIAAFAIGNLGADLPGVNPGDAAGVLVGAGIILVLVFLVYKFKSRVAAILLLLLSLSDFLIKPGFITVLVLFLGFELVLATFKLRKFS